MVIAKVETPFGALGIATSARGVVEVNLLGPVLDDDPSAADPEAQAVAELAAQQFREYFAGQRREFALPLDCDVFTQDSFRARALTALRDVPYGQVVTYGELAEMAGSPRAARACRVGLCHQSAGYSDSLSPRGARQWGSGIFRCLCRWP